MNAISREETICALSTPQGVGGIAVVRVSGKAAWEIVGKLFSKPFQPEQKRKALFGCIFDGKEILDEVVVTLFQGPHSFTGEDVVEIACHGSRYVQQRILQLLQENGCRMATAGEYTMRAYLNGRMDLSRAEAVGDVIASESAAAHKQAVHQMRGGFSKEIDGLRERLIHFASLLELELDFSEEDVEFADRTQLLNLLNEILKVVVQLRDSFQLGNAIKNGVPVAIVGAPNAGKSTLLNALLNEERAIVSDIAGTTRDTVEEVLNVEGIQFRFIDTAGIRETSDTIEQMGIARSMEKVSHAQLVLLLVDVVNTSQAQIDEMLESIRSHARAEAKVLVVFNKIDSNPNFELKVEGTNALRISAKEGSGISELRSWLVESFAPLLNESDTVVTNARHFESLRLAALSLEEVLNGMNLGVPSDLLTVDIRKTLYHLSEITGSISADDILHSIFGKFCIGK
ncbi:MAG: tRNA uridine-5-carboxymethylaminomethyl(34) synthesis GTPase MnmE [Sediminibacterium sp.]